MEELLVLSSVNRFLAAVHLSAEISQIWEPRRRYALCNARAIGSMRSRAVTSNVADMCLRFMGGVTRSLNISYLKAIPISQSPTVSKEIR